MPKAKDTRKKTRSRKKGSAAVDAKLFSGAGGGKGVGKVEITKSVSLAKSATGKPATINARITQGSESFSPSDRAKERADKRASGPQLAKRLTAIAAGVGPGRSKVGAAISGGLTGAALGATIGEEIDRVRKARTKKKKKPK